MVQNQTFTIGMPESLRSRINARSEALGVSVGAFLRLAAAEKLERDVRG